MLRRFRLEEPESAQEASELLARYGESARIYAGGTELLLVMKEGLARYERLINVKRIRDLDQVRAENGVIRVGALATHRKLEEDPVLKQRLPAFARMEHEIANVRVREVGTLGGNLSFAEPHADPGTLLIALGATLVAAKGASTREVPAEKFFLDAFETALAPDELLTEIRVPAPPARSSAGYLKFGYLERPSVGVGIFLSLAADGRSVAEARIAVGCAGPRPKRVEEAEGVIKGKSLDEASRLIGEAGEAAGLAAEAMSDIHGAADYKEHLVQVLLKRAFQKAVQECAAGAAHHGGGHG
jgi:aerobic carbon-monoxide dehydrogenase medium subunit